MPSNHLKSDFLLLLTAVIWGFAFVAQRLGMDHVGPFTFNAVRFALGSLSLVPLILLSNRKANRVTRVLPPPSLKLTLIGGVLAGSALFAGSSLQQVGLLYTTAGKAGFITGLYVVIVPLLGLLWKQRPSAGTWAGALLAATGLYFLSVNEEFSISKGDLLELIGALFWSVHVLVIGWLSPRTDTLKLSALQFAACALLSGLTAFVFESPGLASIVQAWAPILYGGLLSVGVAYTLQILAQRDANPAHSAILLSLEGVFAALGGWMILGEQLSSRALLGCGLMLLGMLLTELSSLLWKAPKACGRQSS